MTSLEKDPPQGVGSGWGTVTRTAEHLADEVREVLALRDASPAVDLEARTSHARS